MASTKIKMSVITRCQARFPAQFRGGAGAAGTKIFLQRLPEFGNGYQKFGNGYQNFLTGKTENGVTKTFIKRLSFFRLYFS